MPDTILIVEDDVALAEMACEVIEMSGLSAVYRTTVADAMQYIARHAESTVALVTDINLESPMTGIELAIYVGEEWPHIAICVTSGRGAHRPNRLPERATYLAKPWATSDLLRFAEGAGRKPPTDQSATPTA